MMILQQSWRLILLCISFLCIASPLAYSHERPHQQVELTAKERAFIKQHPEITLVSGDSFEPFTILNADGSISGFDADLLDIISQRTGLKINLVLGDWAEVQDQAQQRFYDGLSTATVSEQRKQFFNFSEPYTKLFSVVLVKKGNPLRISTIEDLNGKRIAMQRSNQAFEKMAKETGMVMEPVYLSTIHDLIKSVVSGESDFTILDESYAYIAQLVGLDKFIEVAFILGEKPFDLAFALRNDQPELASIINKGLASITAYEMLILRSRWLGGFGSEKYGDPNVIPFNINEVTFLKKQSWVTVCVTPDGLPFESFNQGKHDGMSRDFLALLTERIGINTRLYPTGSWQETIRALSERQCDISTLAVKSPKHDAFIKYTSPILSSPMAIITRQTEDSISDLSSLSGKQVAMVKDTAAVTFIRTHYPSIRIFEAMSSRQALETVAQNQTQAFIGSTMIAHHIMSKQSALNLKVIGNIPYNMQLSIAVRSDLPELKSIFQKAINLMNKNEIDQIYTKWVTTQYETKMNYDWFIKLTIAGLGLIFTVLFWNYSLRQEKNKTAVALAQLNQMNQLLERKNMELALLATTDELTGLWNRKKINDTLNHEIQLSQRNNYHFGLILIDIDLFKSINDNHGHQIGDEILIEFAKQLRYLARQSDLVARWGGEEFLIICPLTQEIELLQIAERLRLKIALLAFQHIDSLTVSCGVACYQHGENEMALLQRADTALYQAKKAGRNRVMRG